jgi:hypothetical protein
VYHLLKRGFGLVIGFIQYLQSLHTNLLSLSALVLMGLQHGTCNSIIKSLQILHINKVLYSHVKSSQAYLMYSSVLLVPVCSLLACLFACFCRYYSLVTALNWTGISVHFSYKHSAQIPQKTPTIVDVFTVLLLRNGLHNTIFLLLLGMDTIENTGSSIV